MNPKRVMSCKGWIQGIYPDQQEGLSRLFSPEEAHLYATLPKPIPFDHKYLSEDILGAVHPTWIAPFLRTLSSSEIPLFLAAVVRDQGEILAETLGFTDPLPTISPIAKKGLRQILLNQVVYDFELVPRAFLPQSYFYPLIALSSAKLDKLIRYLGLHDLAFEMRQIIATKELKRIFSALNKKEGEFLNRLLIQREPFVFQRLFVSNWDGTKAQLYKLLNERGLIRLGHAVNAESDSFIWYLTHMLNIHQGALLLKHRKRPTHARGDEILKDQIGTILKEDL
jgi:hypothetical protein